MSRCMVYVRQMKLSLSEAKDFIKEENVEETVEV